MGTYNCIPDLRGNNSKSKIVRKIEFGAARIAQRTCCECNSNSSLRNSFGGARAASQKFWYSKVCNSGRLAAPQISAETIPSPKSFLVRSLDFSKAMQLEKTLNLVQLELHHKTLRMQLELQRGQIEFGATPVIHQTFWCSKFCNS